MSLARRTLGVSAHLGNPPLCVDIVEEKRPQLRRSIYATASGLLMYSQNTAPGDGGLDTADQDAPPWWKSYLVQPAEKLLEKLRQLV